MSDLAIRVENLGKRYRLHGARGRYKTLRESLMQSFAVPFRTGQKAAEADSTFWALKDVNFQLDRGDILGIIGRNGAGKSTLLKVLSRITDPTEGEVEIVGRVGSLLEVGTGFHPELTGRENIFLNGAILGMKKSEIASKFDEIVAFAETEKFLDTPVKYYSSGMYMRLAFAVAAHLEPEILIIDEVLAVGDAQFQKKCLGKVQEVGHSGRTVLFVSHNIGAIRGLCGKVVWLEQGRVKMIGDAESVTLRYMSSGSAASGSIAPSQHLQGSGAVTIEHAAVGDAADLPKESFLIGEPIKLTLSYRVRSSSRGSFWLLITSSEGTVVVSSFQRDTSDLVLLAKDGCVSVIISAPTLLPGAYTLSAGIFDSSGSFLDWADSVARIEVLPQFADGRPFDHRLGIVTQELQWRINE